MPLGEEVKRALCCSWWQNVPALLLPWTRHGEQLWGAVQALLNWVRKHSHVQPCVLVFSWMALTQASSLVCCPAAAVVLAGRGTEPQTRPQRGKQQPAALWNKYSQAPAVWPDQFQSCSVTTLLLPQSKTDLQICKQAAL